jgi:hypothetical protein
MDSHAYSLCMHPSKSPIALITTAPLVVLLALSAPLGCSDAPAYDGTAADATSDSASDATLGFPDAASDAAPNDAAGDAATDDLAAADGAATDDAAPDAAGPDLDPIPFVVHEWGTFTSVQGSDGATVPGLHEEEEPLPAFVHGRYAFGPFKQMEELPELVTQKLETPVIYFYADVPRASVDVAFPQGIISEWYPDAEAFAPEIGTLEGFRDGQMRWTVEFTDPATAPAPPAVDPDDIWAPSRAVAARPLRVGDEHERFIFYRGLGRFELPVYVEAHEDGSIEVVNASDVDLPAVFVLNLHDEGALYESLGAIPAGGSVVTTPSPKEIDLDLYVDTAAAGVAEALVASGLYADESRAMVDTWRRSYFLTPGLRVLYVVPRAWTDALLPITISPEPDELVRTLIGRIEVFTPVFEYDTVSLLLGAFDSAADPTAVDLASFGRFAEPRIRRAMALHEDAEFHAFCAALLDRLLVETLAAQP